MLATYQLPVEDFGFVTEGLLYDDVIHDNVLANLYCAPSSVANAIVGLQNSSLYDQSLEENLVGKSYDDWRTLAAELGQLMHTNIAEGGTNYSNLAAGLRAYIQQHGVQDVVEVVGMLPRFPATEIAGVLTGDYPAGFTDAMPTWDFFAEAFSHGYAVVTNVMWLNAALDGPSDPAQPSGHALLAVGMSGDPDQGNAELSFIDPLRAFQDIAFEKQYSSTSGTPLFTSAMKPEPPLSSVAITIPASVSWSTLVTISPISIGGHLYDQTILQGGLRIAYKASAYQFGGNPPGWFNAVDTEPGNGLILDALVVRMKPLERPPIRPVTSIAVASGAWGPLPVVVDHATLAGAISGQSHDLPYIVTNVVSGQLQLEENGVVREMPAGPHSVAPAALLGFLADRTVTPSRRLLWTPPAESAAKVSAFQVFGSGQFFGADSDIRPGLDSVVGFLKTP